MSFLGKSKKSASFFVKRMTAIDDFYGFCRATEEEVKTELNSEVTVTVVDFYKATKGLSTIEKLNDYFAEILDYWDYR